MNTNKDWKLVRVNEAFGDLMYWLERCERKGHLENCPDLVEPWEAFDYEYVPAAPGSPASTVATEGEKDERQGVDVDSFDDPSALAAVADALSEDTSNDNAQFAAAYLYRQAKALTEAPAAGDALDAARYRLAVSDCILLLRGDAALGRAEWDSKLDKLAKTKGAK